MEKEIPAVVPNFELKPLDPEPTTTTAYPESRTKAYTETKSITYPDTRRRKRFIADLISLGIQGFIAFNTKRKVNQLKRGMKQLFERQHRMKNKVVKLEKDIISLACIAIEGLEHLQDELVRQGKH